MSEEKGIIYIMSTAVNGLVKIGQTKTEQYNERMRFLESNGYRNVTGLKREFAIEVQGYKSKEMMLHEIFSKSRVGDTELFSLKIENVIQLLSAFNGKQIYSNFGDTTENTYDTTTEIIESKSIPNGEYYFEKQKKSDNKTVKAVAKVENGNWTILKGSIIGITEDKGVSQKAKLIRENMRYDDIGYLLEDFELGSCTPSFAGVVIMNQSINGWTDWHNKNGNQLDIYRKKDETEN